MSWSGEQQGYYRFPTIYKDKLVFVSEDDLWEVKTEGGISRRLTTGLGASQNPVFSRDGKWIAFSGREEGPLEVYVMEACGSQPRRLTFSGGDAIVVGWTPEGKVLFTSNEANPFRISNLYTVALDGGIPEQVPVGPATFMSCSPEGGRVLQRHGLRFAYWKRYKGGTKGEIWLQSSSQNFKKIVDLNGNLARPLWVGERIYFAADHEGIGNLYSCDLEGKDIKQHTYHKDFYVRFQTTDGQRIAYQAGGELYVYDIEKDKNYRVTIDYHSPRTQRNRKFIKASRYLTHHSLHPKGHMLSSVVRGKVVTYGNWEGPVIQHGVREGVRYRFASWLTDGERLLLVRYQDGGDGIEVFNTKTHSCEQLNLTLNVGRITNVMVGGPQEHQRILLTNHRHELIEINLTEAVAKVLDRSIAGPIHSFDISFDGRWAVYNFYPRLDTSILKLCNLETGDTHIITQELRKDLAPVFDVEGKYLYFISHRHFEPIQDQLHFEFGFPKASKPYVMLLQKDLPSPFMPFPKPEEDKKEEGEGAGTLSAAENDHKGEEVENQASEDKDKASKTSEEQKRLEIDLAGLENRILAFPVEVGVYHKISSANNGRVFWQTTPQQNLHVYEDDDDHPDYKEDVLEVFNFDSLQKEFYEDKISDFTMSADGKWLSYSSGNSIRVMRSSGKPDDSYDASYKKTGWIDLSRIKISVDPAQEWQQMFYEAWALQKDNFWTENMSEIDWDEVKTRYQPLVERIGSRGEMSDLLWEMLGELGTSHAYEYGGDYRPHPHYNIGSLGADLVYDGAHDAYRISHIARGDFWEQKSSSPLGRPGTPIQEGDLILAINGQRLSRTLTPGATLVNLANHEVQLTIQKQATRDEEITVPIVKEVTVKTLTSQNSARYRDWVDNNAKRVHAWSKGKVGYVHIPDMSGWGFAEFHRRFLAEYSREGIVVDVRFNSGGSVSWLLMEKLARRRLGYDHTRWMGNIPYPSDSPHGPMVALTNQYAASDGDMFSHAFKTVKLGPLIGKRTWGGVIGIWPRYPLVDGTMTTQPEFSIWFKDIGWQLENYGAVPDIEVDITPEEYAADQDPQLEQSVKEVLKIIESSPPTQPHFGPYPNLGSWQKR